MKISNSVIYGIDGATPEFMTRIKHLSKISPTRSTVAILFDWSIIFLAINSAIYLNNIYLYPIFVIIIGARQHALGVLMHDASHTRLFKKRWINDAVAELFLAWPLLFSMKNYRANHIQHHRHLNTNKDPDLVRKTGCGEKIAAYWRFPMKRRKLYKILTKSLCGLDMLFIIKILIKFSFKSKRAKEKQDYIDKYARLSFYTLIATVLILANCWAEFIFYWLVPIFTYFSFVIRFKAIAEHFGIKNHDKYTMSRTTQTSLIESFFIAPHNVAYHLDHHLYPNIPFYNLKKLHKELMKFNSYSKRAHISKSYWKVFTECTQ